MKKLLIVFLFSTLFLTAISSPAHANMFNVFRKGFYFEKYKTADEAKAALLEIHPIGSDVEALIKTLKKTGAKLTIYKKENGLFEYTSDTSKEKIAWKKVVRIKIDKISDPKQDYLNFTYKFDRLQPNSIRAESWYLNIKVDPQNLNNVFNIEVNRYISNVYHFDI